MREEEKIRKKNLKGILKSFAYRNILGIYSHNLYIDSVYTLMQFMYKNGLYIKKKQRPQSAHSI